MVISKCHFKERRLIMKNILKKIDNIKEKKVLNTVKNIIVKEYKKDYYMNVSNVKEQIELDSRIIKYGENEKYLYVANMWIWDNGFVSFDHKNITINGFKVAKDTKEYKYQKKRK